MASDEECPDGKGGEENSLLPSIDGWRRRRRRRRRYFFSPRAALATPVNHLFPTSRSQGDVRAHRMLKTDVELQARKRSQLR